MAFLYTDYIRWQYVVAPRWLLHLLWTMERALLRFFSVGFLITTLFSYWHRDRVSLRQGSFSGMLVALAWNGISRMIGAFIRSVVLAVWVVFQVCFVGLAAVVFVAFLVWPLAVVGLVAWGGLLLLVA